MGATITLSHEVAVKLQNLKNPQARQGLSTLTPTGVSLHPFRNWPISLTGRV